MISWFSEQNVNIDYVSPNINDENQTSDSDEDVKVERCVGSVLTEKPQTATPETTTSKTTSSKNTETNRNTKKTTSSFPCNNENCNSTFTRRSDLKRHILRFHGAENLKSAESGKCVCVECGHRCHRITDLRKHLSGCHNMEFRTELITFDNKAGIFIFLHFPYSYSKGVGRVVCAWDGVAYLPKLTNIFKPGKSEVGKPIIPTIL